MAWYSLGTVNVTAGNNVVLGTGTMFAVNARNGDAFLGPDGRWYEILNIISDTSLSISPSYIGSTATLANYKIAPMQGYVKESADILREVTDDLTNRLNAIDNLDAAELSALDGITGNIQSQLDNKMSGVPAYYLSRTNHTDTQAISTIAGLQSALDGKQQLSSILTATTASFTSALETKLGGIATNATANQTDIYLLARANHSGTQAISTVTGLQSALDGKQPLNSILTGTEESFTTTQKTKLDGIAAGATVNQTDAYLLDRTHHTGVQAMSTITGLADEFDTKQDVLVSGVTIKTINGTSILSGGDITISGDIVLNGIQILNGLSGEEVNLVPSDIGAATAAQGALADSAIQESDMETYVDGALVNYVTTTGLAAGLATRASAAQGMLADSALQPGAIEANAYVKRIRTLALAAI